MSETLKKRIKERLDALGKSAWQVSKDATGNEDAIRRINRGHMPTSDRLEKLARELQTTTAWLLGDEEQPTPKIEGPTLHAPTLGFRPQELPRDVPVYGTAMGSEMHFRREGNELHVERTILELVDVIDYLRRPPILAGRRDIYGLYITGSSMEPRFDPGDPVYVDPKRPPSIGDDVIVQLRSQEESDDPQVVSALVKQLVRRSSQYVELRQFNPDIEFRVDMKLIAHIHRIVPRRELFGV